MNRAESLCVRMRFVKPYICVAGGKCVERVCVCTLCKSRDDCPIARQTKVPNSTPLFALSLCISLCPLCYLCGCLCPFCMCVRLSVCLSISRRACLYLVPCARSRVCPYHCISATHSLPSCTCSHRSREAAHECFSAHRRSRMRHSWQR